MSSRRIEAGRAVGPALMATGNLSKDGAGTARRAVGDELGPSERRALAALPTRSRSSTSRNVVAVVLVLALAFWIQGLIRNQAMQWHVIAQYTFSSRILHGALTTIELAAYSLLLGFVMGLIIAMFRLSNSVVLRAIGAGYVWLFRSIPVLVLLILANNIALLYPHISLGVPFGPTFFSGDLRSAIPAFGVSVIAFAANEAANAAEIFRASIRGVHHTQHEAATALGMPQSRIYRRIIIPQAMRMAIPPLTNDAINMMKNTSLVAFVAIPDLLYTAQSIYTQTYAVFPMLLVVTIWYIVIVSILTVLQSFIERRFDKDLRNAPTRLRVLRWSR